MPSALTTPGQLLLRSIVPEDIPIPDTMDKKSVSALFQELAEKHPEKYVDVLKAISDESRLAATTYGREASFGLADFETPPEAAKKRELLKKQINKIAQSDTLDAKSKNDRIVELLRSQADDIRHDAVSEAESRGNAMAIAAKRGFRGNTLQASQLLYGDVLLADHKGRPVAIPGMHGYGEGVTPMEYWAGSYGARKGAADVQFATARTGFLSKQMSYMAQRIRVTGEDCHSKDTGLYVKPEDPEILGYTLAKDTAGLPAGTTIDKKNLGKLAGQDKVMVRSLVTCQMPEGVCKLCAGKRENHQFPPLGSYLGITSARVASEPWTQQLGLCLHPETEVRMADQSVKLLKDIRIGDWVLGASPTDINTFPVRVVAIHSNVDRLVFSHNFEKKDAGKLSLRSTHEHKVKVGNWWGVGEKPYERVLKPVMHSAGDCESNRTCAILADGALAVYEGYYFEGMMDTLDLEVDHPEHLFVLANGLVVHNSGKHLGGTVSSSQSVTGLDEIQQFLNVPENFRGKSILAPEDGLVTAVQQAPQGGTYVFVGSKQNYVPAGVNLTVKKGDKVEAGDMLSEGTPHPAEIARYKGLGAARSYFVDKFGEILKDNGVPAHRRHLETISRAFYDRVLVTDPEGISGYDPGETVSYTDIARKYKPRPTSVIKPPTSQTGRYLETPVLHYTIGTRLTPSVVQKLNDSGVTEVTANDDPPGFEPEVMRMMDIPATDPDWKVRLSGFYLKKSLLDSVQHGSTSQNTSTSYVPQLMNPSLIGKRG